MPQLLTPEQIGHLFNGRNLCRCVPTNPDCPLCRRGFAYKFAPSGYAMDSVLQTKVDVDESKMCAKLVFAAGNDRDRKGDIMEVGGIDTSNHKRTPVCYLDHGRNCSLPLAKCQDPAGNYTVVLDTKSQQAWAWTYFCQGLEIAEQVFYLICKGFLASGSIGYRPVKAVYLPPDPHRGLPAGLHLLNVDMVEATWTGMPVNPEATRSLLESGKVLGKSLAPEVKSALLPFAAPKNVWCPGFTPTEKQMGSMMAADDTNQSGQQPVDGGVPVDEAEKSGKSEKYGCQWLRAFHGDLGDMLKHFDGLHEQNEEPKVRKHAARALNALHKIASETSALHKGLYAKSDPLEHDEYVSKRKPLGAADSGEQEEEEETETAEGGDESGEDLEESEENTETSQERTNADETGEEAVAEAGGEKKAKKKPPFKKDKSLVPDDDISEEQAAALLASLKEIREEIKTARPAGV